MDDPRRGRVNRNDGGNGRKRQDSFFSDDSDGSPDEQSVRGFDSGSDSDPKKWTKNPLVVRRVKRSDKGKQTEKRLSATENGIATKNLNSFGYPANEEGSSGTGSLGRGTSGSKDAGSASRGSSKFQRLEEMRKRRINLCVTSDEEATPSFSKTRLRQKAFQDRPVSTYHVSPPRWEAGAEQGQARSFISSVFSNRHFPPSSPEVVSHHQTFSATPSFPLKTILTNQAPTVSSQSYNAASGNLKTPQPTAGYSSSPSFPRNVAKTSSPLPRSDSIRPYWMSQTLQSSTHTSPATQQSPLRHQQLSTTTYTQPHKTDRHSDPGAPILSSSFHEVMVHRLTTQAEPSVTLTTKPSARNTYQPQQVSHSQTLNQARWNPTSKREANRPVSIVSSKSYPQNELDIRLKKPQQLVALGKPAVIRQSDDSLDELIESNIQYLDTELEKSKPKKISSTNIIKLSDSRKKFSAPPKQDQQSIQVAASTSIEFRVSLPSELRLPEKQLGVPVLQISASNPSFSFDKQIINQPDVVPRHYNRDRFTRLSRPNSEYNNKDDVSKSPSVVTSQLVLHGHYGNTGQANNARDETGLVAFKPNTGNHLRAPQIDKGMFSDVEYDIEVSERVKKWETFMKDKDLPSERNQLTTIRESVKDDASDAQKAVVLSKSWTSGPSYQSNNSEPASNRSKLFSSDIPSRRYDKETAQPMFSVDTNVQKFFHTIQNPRVSLKPQNVNTLFHTPVSIERPLTIARDHALTNKPATPLQITAGPTHAVLEPTSAHVTGKQVVPLSLSSSDTSSFSKTEAKDAAKRESRYRDELAEISQVKSDSVLSLRRRFDTDSATMTSEDDMVSVSTASAKLSRPSKKSPQNKDSTDWSKVLPGYQTMIKDSDVWSPNLESTQGVPVSIERVTARTLQTIPFSEDPFWKELEQMTTFDPSSLAGHLNLSRLPEKSMIAEPIRSQHQVELSAPHSSTLPSQPRSNVMSFKERMQRSKSLYTPNIIPLTINVADREPSSAAIALDEVLNDINKSSMERKQMSPKKRAVENDGGLLNLGVTNTTGYLKPKFDKGNIESKFEGSKLSFGKIGTEKNLYPAKPAQTTDTVYRGPGMAIDQPKQPVQFYQNQRQEQPQTQNRQSLTLPSNVNNYQLDPHLLKEKLLSTGLVIETDTEEPANNQQRPSSFLNLSTQRPVAYTTPGLSSNTADPRTFNKNAVSQISNPTTAHISNLKTSQFSKPTTSELSKPTSLQFSKPTTSELSKPTTLQFSKPKTSELSKPTATTLQFSKPATSQVTIPTVSQIPNSTTSQISNPAVAAPMAGIILDSPTKRPGTRALDDIQKALAPFTSTSYQPDPETLYGSSKLQSFSQPNFDTTRGPQTTSTSWLYKLHPKDADQAKIKENAGENSSSRLQQVNKSMDDLKHLARDVEQRINVIKQKLVAADENSLDSILCSLRKVTPEMQSQEAEPRSLEDFYTTKKSKLSDALSELDRICKNLELSADDLANFQDAKTKEALESNYFIRGQQPKSVHLRPMQTRISSVFIPGLDKKKDDNESEFDIISKSFQAIVDEVNQTTDMLSRASERQKKESTAPETHKQIFKTTVKPGYNESASSSSARHAVSTTTESKSLGGVENKTEEIKSKGGLFKSKESWRKDEPIISAASENLQTEESKHDDLLGPNTESMSVTDQVSQETEQLTLDATPSSSTAQQQSRVRPVKDNKIIQEDRANKKEGTRNVSSSPTVSRRIFGEQELDQPRFQESTEKVSEKQTALKQQTENLEDGLGSKSKAPEHEDKSFSGPSVLGATSASTAGSKSMGEGISTALKLSINKSILSGSSSGSSSALSHQSSSASTTSINLTPPVSESSQQKAFTASSKPDDSESSSNTGLKTKRRLGTGVAMMLDKFSSGEDIDSPKKQGGLDQLSGSTQCEASIDDKNSNLAPVVEAGGEKPSPPPQLKNPARSLTRKLSESKGVLGSPKERKVVDFDTKFTRSRTTSPQPSSPVNKPPLSPFRKQTSDSEIIADNIKQPSSGGSIKHVSKIPRPIVSTATTDRQLTSKGKDNTAQVAPQIQTKTLKSTDRKPQIVSLRSRPHSFHELISCFETGQDRLQSSDKFRKCASAGEVSSEALTDEVFDEPGHARLDNLEARECGIRNKVAKFENKS